ncbi:hypothetical protein [Sphingobacterium siyangense]|uniref:hypothetical protein n=1 Tax=Sphingobacterium siyangense TaxID=459529 RepID=UPI003018142D
MDAKNILDFLKDEGTIRCAWGYELVKTSLETNPKNYLEYAEEDLNTNLTHKYINALSNIKRALDGQADRLMKLLGVQQKRTIGFPKKLEYLQKVEILAPRILNKINRHRNLVEHDYNNPKQEDVEDFFDIVSLFISSTEWYVENTIRLVEYNNEENEDFQMYNNIEVTVDNENSQLLIRRLKPNLKSCIDELIVNINDSNYFEILKFHLKKVEFR